MSTLPLVEFKWRLHPLTSLLTLRLVLERNR
jgi:hypothetical protein